MKERRGGSRVGDVSDELRLERSLRERRRARGLTFDDEEVAASSERQHDISGKGSGWMGSLERAELAKLQTTIPTKLTRVELETARMERAAPMSPQQALAYARWMGEEERGWHNSGETTSSGGLSSLFGFLEPAHVSTEAIDANHRGVQHEETTTLSAAMRVEQMSLGHFQSRGLLEILAAISELQGESSLQEATLFAAKMSREPRSPSHRSISALPDLPGQTMWRAAERRAGTLYRRALEGGETSVDDPSIDASLALVGGGAPLPEDVRRKMEIALGVSLHRVKVHTDSIAASAARALNARAFTVGEDIFFAEGEYETRSVAGQKLLAHELAHVVQAYQGRIASAGNRLEVSHPGESLEREAEEVASRISERLASSSELKDRKVKPVSTWADAPRASPASAIVKHEASSVASGPPIMRQAAPGRPISGRPVRKHGIAYQPDGVNLRERASPSGKILQRLNFNTRVFVDSQEGGWYFVTTSDGKFGYCLTTHLKIDLPEPNATIHWIESGETALSISHKHYGGKAEWGSDHRFYVNGLVYVNRGPGKRGIFKPEADADWDTTKVLSDYMIWIPSKDFMKSLRGKVSSGSITYEAWQKVTSAAETAGEFLLGTGSFIAGLLHGALESLWDVLVGLKDLAVMLWDILKSIITGNLLSDIRGLWNDLSNLDWKKLVQGWISGFDAKWSSNSIIERWHFRGWVIGYAIMEVLMFFFSGGIIQGIKWVGKSAKVAKVLQSLPRLKKLSTAIKGSKAYGTVSKALSRGERIASNAKRARKWVSNLIPQPKSIWGKSPEQLAEVFREAGYEVVIEQSKKGSKLSKQLRITKHKEITNIQVHPGGGRHGGSYYKISTSTKGIIKVVDKATYVPIKGEKATIIYMSGPEGWMLQAAAANSAAQNAGEEVGENRTREE
jgi:Domain of unknown function (DUF4157)/Bacterial SH3 domain